MRSYLSTLLRLMKGRECREWGNIEDYSPQNPLVMQLTIIVVPSTRLKETIQDKEAVVGINLLIIHYKEIRLIHSVIKHSTILKVLGHMLK